MFFCINNLIKVTNYKLNVVYISLLIKKFGLEFWNFRQCQRIKMIKIIILSKLLKIEKNFVFEFFNISFFSDEQINSQNFSIQIRNVFLIFTIYFFCLLICLCHNIYAIFNFFILSFIRFLKGCKWRHIFHFTLVLILNKS